MDKKALRILFDTFWSPAGWRDEDGRLVASEEFQYAKRAGLMFEPIGLSHDQIVHRVLGVRAAVQAAEVTDAFLASLTTRRLDLRSALGSYAFLRHFPDHEHEGTSDACEVCGEPRFPGSVVNLSLLNFERFKWGGVRHDRAIYAAFDLERFLATERPESTVGDAAILKSILASIDGVGPDITAAQLQHSLAPQLKSNKAEREVIINILGYCGILRVAGRPTYWDRFVPHAERILPPQRFVDMAYPVCWWRGRDGLDRNAIRMVFPKI